MYYPIHAKAWPVDIENYFDGGVPASFYAFLYKSLNPYGQAKLTIKLSIKFRPLQPKAIPFQQDAGGRPGHDGRNFSLALVALRFAGCRAVGVPFGPRTGQSTRTSGDRSRNRSF